MLGHADGRLHQHSAVGRIAQKAPPGGRGEGHGDLKLGVIAPARAGVSLGPAVVKDVFALRVAFHVKRHRRHHPALVAQDQGPRLPAGAVPGGAGGFQRSQKTVGGEGVNRATRGRLGAGERVPVLRWDRGHAVKKFSRIRHASPRGSLVLKDGAGRAKVKPGAGQDTPQR